MNRLISRGAAVAGAAVFSMSPAADHDPVSAEAAACPGCGVVRAVREITGSRPVPRGPSAVEPRANLAYVTGPGAPLPVGPVISRRWGAGVPSETYVGARGSARMIESLKEITFEVIIRLDAGGYTRLEGAGFSDLRVGERVKVIDGRIEIAP